MSTTDIRTAITEAIDAFKAGTGQMPIRMQVSSTHLSDLEHSEYELPDGTAIPIDYVENIAPGMVRCIGPEAISDEPG